MDNFDRKSRRGYSLNIVLCIITLFGILFFASLVIRSGGIEWTAQASIEDEEPEEEPADEEEDEEPDCDSLCEEDVAAVCDLEGDCDGDGWDNGVECEAGSCPCDAADTPGCDYLCAEDIAAVCDLEGDCDGDGLSNARECELGTDPCDGNDPDCIGYKATMDTYGSLYEEAKTEYDDAKEKVVAVQAILDEIWPIYKNKHKVECSIKDLKVIIEETDEKLKELRIEFADLVKEIAYIALMSGASDAEEDSITENFCAITGGIVACKEWKELNEKIIKLEEDLKADKKILSNLEAEYDKIMELDEIYWENIKIRNSYDLVKLKEWVNYNKDKYDPAKELYELYCS